VTGEVLPARAARPVDGQLRQTVHVSGAPAGLTVGPDEVLVLAYPLDGRYFPGPHDTHFCPAAP
jgi:hypothetical protein